MDFDDYKNKLEYPEKPGRPQVPSIKILNSGAIDIAIKAFQGYVENLSSYKKELIEYEKKMVCWKKEEGNLFEKFKLDLFKEFGIENNPKKDMLFQKAWSDGHYAGYPEVYSKMDELVDLIK